ncbi:hypothetical protein KSP35_13420 [Aquihabitans sp. G128]|uniref:hypothetical protein n=1 Tax=Aquihabitans sp. G128 TaxID=2849779 RepID=UPI001C241658|nr:hypothetical protein [Aquihabitans sp. G128]QXC59400.1 hypothetical protein KSP35_13420 [Aquihabitans sp. G128]
MTTTPTHRSARTAAALVLAAVLLASCGSTRYVVVQGGGGAAAAAPTTTVAAGPTSAEDEKAVKEAVEAALGLDPEVGFDERLPYLEDAEDIEPTYDAVLELVSSVDAELKVVSVVVNGDTATATVDVIVAGAPYAEGVPVEVVKDGDAWKVTRGGACAALAIGSPCPEQ